MASREPQVSVIVPIYNVERYLGECLESLAAQTLEGIEVILVDDGSTDGSSAIAERFAQKHPAFAYHRRENGGVSRARNYGASVVHGDYIAFVDSDDIVADTLFERMLATALRDGSDVVTTNVRRFNSEKALRSNVHERAFANAPHVCSIASWPALAFDTTMCNKLIKRSFYEAHGLSFPEGMRYEDIPASLELYSFADRVSILLTYGYFWRARETDELSLTQRVDDVEPVLDRLKALRMVDAFYGEHPEMAAASSAWKRKALEIDIPFVVRRIPNYTQRDAEIVLAEVLDYLADNADLSLLPDLPIDKEQCIRAAMDADLDAIARTVDFVLNHYRSVPAKMEGDRLLATLPDELFTTPRRDILPETALLRTECIVRGVRSRGSALSVTALLHAPRLSVPEDTQVVQVRLVNDTTGSEIKLPADGADASDLTLDQGMVTGSYDGADAHYDYDGAGFRCIVDLADEQVCEALHEGIWHFEVSYRNDHASGSSILSLVTDELGRAPAGLAAVHEGKRAAVALDKIGQLSLCVDALPVYLAEVSACDGGIRICANDSAAALRAVDRFGRVCASDACGTLELTGDGLYAGCELAVRYAAASGEWCELVGSERRRQMLPLQNVVAIAYTAKTLGLRIRVEESAAQLVGIEREGKTLLLDAIGIAQEGVAPDGARMRLIMVDAHTLERTVLSDVPAAADGGLWHCRFAFCLADELEAGHLTVGAHALKVAWAHGGTVAHTGDLYCTLGLSRRIRDGRSNATIAANATGRATLAIRREWSDDLSTPAKRKTRVLEVYPGYLAKPLDDKLVFFESRGGACTGGPRAVYEYLCENYPEYHYVWTMADGVTALDGPGETTRKGSTKYYRQLARAKYIVTDCELGVLFVKREGQVIVWLPEIGSEMLLAEKASGASDDGGEGASQSSSPWDYVAVQGEAQEEYLQRSHPGSYRVLRCGSPGTDQLYGRSAAARLRKQLGIPEGMCVVLYAPSAEGADSRDFAFDAREACEHLPSDFVVLLAEGSADGTCVRPEGTPLAIDVSRYREKTELLQCADVLIAEPSQSLIDYAVTGRPLVALADAQGGASGEMQKLLDLLPGPIAHSAAEAFSMAGDAAASSLRYREQARVFTQRYLGCERVDSCKAIARQVFAAKGLFGRFGR